MVIPTEPIWVDDKATLDSLCASWMQQAAIAIDTEFMRSSTYYPHAGLIQVGDGKGCYLIDPDTGGHTLLLPKANGAQPPC